MGLLCSGPYEVDKVLCYRVCRSLVRIWEANLAGPWGYDLIIESPGVDRSCLLAQDFLFTGTSFPSSPGPFKRAAAFALLLRQQFDIRFVPVDGNSEEMTAEQVDAWRARVALLSIPIVLKIGSIQGRKLEKDWIPATDHVRCEMLAWLRWMRPPVDVTGSIDIARLLRSILIFAMTIEQSYYLVGATTDCDVIGRCGCEVDPDDEIIGPDAYFLPKS